MENIRNSKGREKSIIFLQLTKNKFYFIILVLLSGMGSSSTFLLHSIYGNTMDVSKTIITNAQVQYSTMDENIVDLKVSERNNNYVWTSMNGQANPDLHLKSGTPYTIQVESMENNISHQLIIQTESGKQLTKSDVISNGNTDDFTFTFSEKGTYQYHCQYHPKTMYGNIIVS